MDATASSLAKLLRVAGKSTTKLAAGTPQGSSSLRRSNSLNHGWRPSVETISDCSLDFEILKILSCMRVVSYSWTSQVSLGPKERKGRGDTQSNRVRRLCHLELVVSLPLPLSIRPSLVKPSLCRPTIYNTNTYLGTAATYMVGVRPYVIIARHAVGTQKKRDW